MAVKTGSIAGTAPLDASMTRWPAASSVRPARSIDPRASAGGSAVGTVALIRLD